MYCERSSFLLSQYINQITDTIRADDIIYCDMTPTHSLLPSFVFYLFDDPEVSGFFK